jgi:hypothetical protein
LGAQEQQEKKTKEKQLGVLILKPWEQNTEAQNHPFPHLLLPKPRGFH